jgi:4-amino-4-deoxy-L-arabinose transferase-like glycosyltransferase
VSTSYIDKRAAADVATLIRGAATSSLAVGVLVIVAHLPSFLHQLLDGDEAIYGSIAVLMNIGGSLYGDGGVDNKPPGIYWVYALTFRVFGAYNMTAVHAVSLVALLATCLLVFLIARDIASPRAGLLAALFYGLLTAAGNPRLLAANTELFMMLPLTGSVLFLLRRQWLWSGALLVVALAFRQSAAINVLLLALAVIWLEPASGRLRAAALATGGAVAALIVAAALLALTGSPAGFWRWAIGTLVGYASTNWTPSLVWMRARDSIVPFIIDMAVFWIAAIALATRWRTLPVAVRLTVVWLAVAMAGSLAGGHLSWHYFIQPMGPLAVVAALAFDRFRLRRAVAVAAVVGVAVPAVAWWVFDVTADPLTYDFDRPVPQHEAVAAYIAAHTSPSDRVFVWGNWPALYVESGRVMSSRFPGFLRGFARGSDLPPNSWDVAPDVWPLLQADLGAHPPALVVDTAAAGWSDFARYPMRNYPVIADLVARQYHQVAVVDGVVIYARNGA